MGINCWDMGVKLARLFYKHLWDIYCVVGIREVMLHNDLLVNGDNLYHGGFI